MERDSLPDELWSTIPGHPHYEVSNFGRVFAHRRERVTGGIKKLTLDSFGYPCCTMGRGNTMRVHTLVLLAFTGPAPAGCEACHYNGVRTDNRLANLRWDTRTGNMADYSRHYYERRV